MTTRRLPVYFLLDCSESMIGPAVDSVQSGVERMISELRQDPQALETASVSLITFGQGAKQIMPLTELLAVQIPQLRVGPGTAMGAGLRLLSDCINRDVRKTTREQKGDYRPLVFLLTDGQPTDDWESAVDDLWSKTESRIANIYAVGCGDDVDYGLLGRVSDIVFRLDEMTSEKMNQLFVWLTASIRSASASLGTTGAGSGIDLSKLPDDVTRVEPGSYTRPTGPPRQVFVDARCSGNRKPYVMRYKLDPIGGQYYMPSASHPLEENHSSGGSELQGLDSSLLDGCPACCYCENSGACACGCGTVMCIAEPAPASIVCPGCGATLRTSSESGGGFQVKQ